MSVFRLHRHDKGFAAIANETLRDRGLSFRARGLLAYLLSQPPTFQCRAEDLVTEQEGRDAIRTALRELEAATYLLRDPEQDRHGRWRTVVHVFELPQGTAQPMSWVYYMEGHDGSVKIGVSRKPKTRLRQLKGVSILAQEPGDWRVEQERHQRFSALHLRDEWFQHEGELKAHIALLAAEPRPDEPFSVPPGKTQVTPKTAEPFSGWPGPKDLEDVQSKTEDVDRSAENPKSSGEGRAKFKEVKERLAAEIGKDEASEAS